MFKRVIQTIKFMAPYWSIYRSDDATNKCNKRLHFPLKLLYYHTRHTNTRVHTHASHKHRFGNMPSKATPSQEWHSSLLFTCPLCADTHLTSGSPIFKMRLQVKPNLKKVCGIYSLQCFCLLVMETSGYVKTIRVPFSCSVFFNRQ